MILFPISTDYKTIQDEQLSWAFGYILCMDATHYVSNASDVTNLTSDYVNYEEFRNNFYR